MKKIALLMLVFTLFAGTSVYAQKLKNGTYESEGRYRGVKVTVSGRKIKEISVYYTNQWMEDLINGNGIEIEHGSYYYRGYPMDPKQEQDYKENYELLKKEGPRYTSVQEFADAIVTNQSTVIDVMCGATQTCEAVIEAVHEALDDKQVYSYSQGRYVTTKNNGDIVRAWEQEGKQKRLATAQRREKLKEEERQRIAKAEAEKKRQEEEAKQKVEDDRQKRIAEALTQEPVTPPESDFKYDIASDGGVKIIKYLGNAMSIKIPEKIEGLTVTEIGYAFDKNTLVKIVIPGTIKAMMSFSGFTELREVILEDGVTNIQGAGYGPWEENRIEDGVFESCTNLTKVVLPNSLESIGAAAFYKCEKLESIELPAKLKSIGREAFRESGLTSIVIPDSVESISESAFGQCKNLKYVKLPSKLKTIAPATFEETALTSIIIPNSVSKINAIAFYKCTSLASVTLPENLIEIGYAVFAQCHSLADIIIPVTLKKVSFYVGWRDDRYKRLYYTTSSSESSKACEVFTNCEIPLATKSKLRELGYSGEF